MDAALNTPEPSPAGAAAPHPSYDVGVLLRQAHARAARAFKVALGPLEIEGRHFGVLAALARAGTALNQRDLIAHVGSDKTSMVRIVDDLEAAGLVTRQPTPGDRRIRSITVTAAGWDTFRAAEHTARGVTAELLDHLEPNERAQLTHLLRRFSHPPSDG